MYNLSRLDPSYIFEVHRFTDAAKNHAWRTKMKHIYCLCIDYKNVVVFYDTEPIISHLACQRFIKDYLICIKHEEGNITPYTIGNPTNIKANGRDILVDRFQFIH